MQDVALELAQDLQSAHSRLMLGKLRQWEEATPAAQAVWLQLARLALEKIGELLQNAARPTAKPAPSGPTLPPAPPEEAQLSRSVSATKAAEMLGVERRSLGRYVKNGMPHWRTPGGQLRFSLEEIRIWKIKSAGFGPPKPEPLTGREIAEAEKRGREIAQSYREWEARRRAKGLSVPKR